MEVSVAKLLHEHEVAPVAAVVFGSVPDVGARSAKRRGHHLDAFEADREARPVRGRRVRDRLDGGASLVIEQRAFRCLAWAYIILTLVFIATGGKSYYIVPMLAVLLGAGLSPLSTGSNAGAPA